MTRVAAVDCGTNSVRLLVAEIVGDGLRDLVREMRIVRLGEGVDKTGSLAPQAIERTRVALEEYAEIISDLGVDRLRMAATSATRDALNRSDFEAMVLDTLNTESEVITGDEEARFSFTGATADLTGVDSPLLIVDIGGGSTEFVLGESAVDSAVSVDIGCVRMTERHLHDDPPTAEQVEAAVRDIRAGISAAGRSVDLDAARTLVGLAGTVTTVTALALGLSDYDAGRIHHARISAADVASVAEMLLSAPHDERVALGPMHPGRVDVIGAGALILREIVTATGADSVLASEHDILDGIALSMC